MVFWVPGGGAMEGFTATVTVSVELPEPFAGRFTCAGAKLQLMPEGAPPQARVTVPLKPPEEFRVTAKLAEPPTEMVALVGVTDPLIPSEVGCVTLPRLKRT